MIPEPDSALRTIMGTLMMEVAPNMGDEYRRANVNLLGAAAALIAAEFDRAAEVRVWENNAMRAIFARAAGLATDPALRSRVVEAAAGADTDLRVSQLTAANTGLRRVLIDLHAMVEESDVRAAVEINKAIWTFLRESAQRRAIVIG